MIRICHITTVHPRYDIRIFYKECISLAKEYDVSLIVADGLKNENINNINIIDIGLRQKSRLKRMFIDSNKAFKKAKALNCDIYHFHDPELILIGLKLKKLGKKVIYDIHEIVSAQVLRKNWIPKYLRILISNVYKIFEKKKLIFFDYLLVPQSVMKNSYLKINKKTDTIFNFVDYETINTKKEIEKYNLIYVGGLSIDRGIFNMLDLLNTLDPQFTLTLVGNFNTVKLFNEVQKHASWSRVNYLGFVNNNEIGNIYLKHSIGLILFNNVGQYYLSYSLKLFEYMKYGLTVIMPNFGDWIQFNEKNKVGYNVNTNNPYEIKNIIDNISSYDFKKRKNNNIYLIKKIYNWENEEKKLLKIYKRTLRKV